MRVVLGIVTLLTCSTAAAAYGAPAVTHTESCNGRGYQLPLGIGVPCSEQWTMHAVCDGTDVWDKWTLTAGPKDPRDNFIHPWLDRPILVLGYELEKLMEPPRDGSPATAQLNDLMSNFAIGSGIQPDSMLSLGPRETRAYKQWPRGYAQPWPATQDKDRSTFDILDVHGVCWGGGGVTMKVTVDYAPMP